MRLLPVLLVLALVAAAWPADAQPPTFTHAYQLRGAVGDIPTTTNDTEPAGAWNLEQRRTVQFTNTSEGRYAFAVPAGASVRNATCSCNPSHATISHDAVVFTFPVTQPSGTYVLTVSTTQEVDSSFGFSLDIATDIPAGDRIALLYVPTGSSYDAPSKAGTSLPSTNGQATILQFNDLPAPFWFSVHPESAVSAGDEDDAMWREWLLPVLLGLVVGMVLWSVLVSKGVVQKKSRRQVANTAAHVEAAATDQPAVLEGKKRALLAALKEIEVARMNNQMAPEVYDVVKADLKKQAVTVMRALESSETKPNEAN